MTTEPFIILRDNINRLSERDQAFAASLLASRTLSEKQHYWIKVLAERATRAAAPAAPAAAPVNLAPIVTLFRNAGALKRPRIVFSDENGVAFRLTRAGERSRVPSSINVTDNSGSFEGRVWYGRIHTDGTFEPSRRADGPHTVAAVTAALVAFAADPAGQARAYGHRTDRCCFCDQELTHAASVKLGYGPICASRWGLPHSYACDDAAPAAPQRVNSVVPCSKGEHCSWPACAPDCAGRPGRPLPPIAPQSEVYRNFTLTLDNGTVTILNPYGFKYASFRGDIGRAKDLVDSELDY